MKIVIVGSVELADKLIEMSEELTKRGIETDIPHTVNRIKNGELTLEDFKKMKKERGGDFSFRQESKVDYLKRYHSLIAASDGILVANFEKNGIKNYIGGNALMELGFAYTLDKPIYLYNDVPDMAYTDEIRSVNPIILNGDLSLIGKS
jgi:hypothetical protein